jgi:Flp pilus assembly pilin Flp
MVRLLGRLATADEGQDLAEYGIALAVIAGFVVAIAVSIANDVNGLWSNAQTSISSAAGAN